MESYNQWLNNKLYDGHIHRLEKIKYDNHKQHKKNHKIRIQSQPSKLNLSQNKKQYLPLPLVSKNERVLLSQVIQTRTINLKQKQTLLENYLLSKRILSTHSVFDSKVLKKQFSFHRKVSSSMNKNFRIHRKAFSEHRIRKFSQLKKLKEPEYPGIGSYLISLKINEIMLIKRKLEDNSISHFNLVFRSQKFKSCCYRSVTFAELTAQLFKFKASKRQIHNKNGLCFEVQEIRGNETHRLAMFSLKPGWLQSDRLQSCKSQEENGVNPEIEGKKCWQQEYVQKLFHPIGETLMGTIKLGWGVNKNNKQ